MEWDEQMAMRDEELKIRVAHLKDRDLYCVVCGQTGESRTFKGGYHAVLCNTDMNTFERAVKTSPLWQDFIRVSAEVDMLRQAHAREDVSALFWPLWERRNQLEDELFGFCAQWCENNRRSETL